YSTAKSLNESRLCTVFNRMSVAMRSTSASSFAIISTRIGSPLPYSLHSVFSNTCALFAINAFRSEERRVGKECRSRWSACQAEDGIRDFHVTGVQTCALPILQHGEVLERKPLVYRVQQDVGRDAFDLGFLVRHHQHPDRIALAVFAPQRFLEYVRVVCD